MIEGASCVVLIGGESRRMGTDKAAVELSGRKLLDHVLDAVLPIFDEVFIGAHDDDPSLIKTLPAGVRVVRDTLPGRGPALGVCSALEAAKNPWVFVVSCDVPMLSGGLVEALALLRENFDAVVPYVKGGPEPTCAFYSKTLLAPLKESVLAGKRGLAYFLKEAEAKGLNIRYADGEELKQADPGLLSFTDIDTPEDLLGVEKFIKEK